MRANCAYHAIALLAGLSACGLSLEPGDESEPGDPPTYGPGLGTAENPIPQDGETYAARSRIARTTDGSVAPDAIDIVAPLRAFSENPGDTLLAIAAGADVPELAQLYGSLSASLESRLAGWIDAELANIKIGSKTVPAFAASVSLYAETALTRFALDSWMSFSPTKSEHTVTGVAFELADVNVVVPIGGLKADVWTQQVDVSVTEGGRMTFGDHQFGLAFGEHVWHGINLASTTVYAVDLRTALTETISCAQLASSVASKCYDGQCVGHQSALQTICTRSLDLLVTDLSTRIGEFDSDVVHYVAGTARLVDENGDGLANRIADGVWDSQLVMGPAKGTFTASAEGR